MTQKQLVALLEELDPNISLTVRTLQNYEDGSPNMPVNVLIALSRIFDCSTDYILGLSGCRTVESGLIRQYTGLSDGSIRKLHLLMQYGNTLPAATVNNLLEKVIPVPPMLKGQRIKGATDTLSLIGLYISGGDLVAEDVTIETGTGHRYPLDGALIAAGGILNLINIKLTEARAGLTRRKAQKKGSISGSKS